MTDGGTRGRSAVSRPRRRASYPVLPLRETLVFPLTTFPLAVGREQSLRAIEEGVRRSSQLALFVQKQADVEDPGPGDLHPTGTLASIRHVVCSPDGSQQVWVQGLERIRAAAFVETELYLEARVEPLPKVDDRSPEVEALARSTLELFQRLVAVSPFLPDELVNRAMNQDSPRGLLYLVASSLRLNVQERVGLLEMDGLRAKYERVVGLLEREIELLELGQKLRGEI